MNFNKFDLEHAKNLLRAYNKGTFSFQGEEVLAMADCMRWVHGLIMLMEKEIEIEKNQQNAPKKEISKKEIALEQPKAVETGAEQPIIAKKRGRKPKVE